MADIFDTSKNMSTYLVCMIICDFEFTEATTAKGVRVSILFTRLGIFSLRSFFRNNIEDTGIWQTVLGCFGVSLMNLRFTVQIPSTF